MNSYVPKSTMGVVYSLKGASSDLMASSENFKLNGNYVNRSRPKIISYLLLADFPTWHLHVTTFFALSIGKMKYTSTLRLVVIFPACVCHCITAYFSIRSFSNRLPIKIVELHPLSNRIRKFLNFTLPLPVFIHTCIDGNDLFHITTK